MKRSFQIAGIFLAFILFSIGATICPAQNGVIVGSYSKTSNADKQVVNAANFAIAAQKTESLKLVSILKAEQQVVAGLNFRLCLSLSSQGKAQQASATVYLNLKNQYSLSSWKLEKCETAETKNVSAKTATAPDRLVKNLYAAHNAQEGPFFQAKNRAIVGKYFAKDLADMIWKDAVDSEKEQGVGAIDFDPLYNAQDMDIKNFVIEKQRDGSPDTRYVKVTFKNFGKAVWIDYELTRDSGEDWKISGISYDSGEDITSILRYSQDEEFKKEYDEFQVFTGEYIVGKTKCNVMPTLNGFSTRIECEGEDGFKLYKFEGDETQNVFIHLDEKGVERGKFIFKNGETNGKFINALGKEVKVSKVE